MARPATGCVIDEKTERGTSYNLRFTALGKRRYVHLGYDFEGWTQQRAEDELTLTMAKVRAGEWRPAEPAPVVMVGDLDPDFRVFASEWFEAHKVELREESVPAVQWRLEYVLLPFFAKHRLSAITVQEVDRFRADQVRRRDRLVALREAEAAKPKAERRKLPRPLSNGTINRCIGLLGQILEQAVEYGHLPANPARGKRRKLKTTKPRRSYLDSAAQITAVLDAAREVDRTTRADRKHLARHAMFSTFVFAGLRLKELRLLRWHNIDLAGGWIRVANMPDDAEAKTDAGQRKIKIRPALRDVLSGYRARIDHPDPGALVFSTSTGNPHAPSNVRRTMRTICDMASAELVAAGGAPLPRLTPHSLRRTWASLLFAIGEPLTVVMSEGGWADSNVPLTIYGHTMLQEPGELERLKALVEGAEFRQPIGSSGETVLPVDLVKEAQSRF